MMSLVPLVVLLGFLAPPPQEDKPKPPVKKPGHRVVRITGDEARQPAEVSVAINPTQPNHIVAVSYQQGRQGQPGSDHIYVSQDGGRTWKTTPGANAESRQQGDDAVVFNAKGVCHRTWISFNGIRTPRPRRANTGIFLASSKDGLTWDKPVPVVDHINSVEPFEDKPWPVVDTVKDSPHYGNIYVAWTRFDVYGSKSPEHKSHILLGRSRDGGKSFLPPVRISDKHGSAIDDSTTVEGAVPAVGLKGEVYVTWAGPQGLVFDKSTDGGASFGQDKVISDLKPGWDFPVAGWPRHNGMPITATDLSAGKDRGSIYVCWMDKRHGDPDVFVLASRDGGATWSESVRVNNDPRGNGKDQAFAWMAVDPVDGAVNVLFYDRRDLQGMKTGLVLARSVDGGRTFVNHKVDQEPFECVEGAFFGDYLGVSAHQGRVVGAYMHFTTKANLALSAALFRFKPGTQELVAEE